MLTTGLDDFVDVAFVPSHFHHPHARSPYPQHAKDAPPLSRGRPAPGVDPSGRSQDRERARRRHKPSTCVRLDRAVAFARFEIVVVDIPVSAAITDAIARQGRDLNGDACALVRRNRWRRCRSHRRGFDFKGLSELHDEPRDAAAHRVRLMNHVLDTHSGDVAMKGNSRHQVWRIELRTRGRRVRGESLLTAAVGVGRDQVVEGKWTSNTSIPRKIGPSVPRHARRVENRVQAPVSGPNR